MLNITSQLGSSVHFYDNIITIVHVCVQLYIYMYIVILKFIIVSQENRESEIFTKKYQTETSAC